MLTLCDEIEAKKEKRETNDKDKEKDKKKEKGVTERVDREFESVEFDFNTENEIDFNDLNDLKCNVLSKYDCIYKVCVSTMH